jgi:hypothetical protein
MISFISVKLDIHRIARALLYHGAVVCRSLNSPFSDYYISYQYSSPSIVSERLGRLTPRCKKCHVIGKFDALAYRQINKSDVIIDFSPSPFSIDLISSLQPRVPPYVTSLSIKGLARDSYIPDK